MLKHSLIVTLFLCVGFSHCAIAANATPPRIVASIHPLGLIASDIAGDASNVEVLIPPGTSPHHYQLKPSQLSALEKADVILWVGNSLEPYLQKVLNNLGDSKTIITIESLTDLKKLNYRALALWSDDDHDHDHVTSIDGHVWLSPDNAITIATQLNNALAQQDASNKPSYEKRLVLFKSNVNAMDKRIGEQLRNYKSTPFFVYHDAFQYFESHYALSARGTFTTESSHALSAKRLKQLTDTALSENIKCIFADQQYSADIPEKVALRTGAKVVSLDHFGVEITANNGGYTRLLETISENMLSCFEQIGGH